VKSDPNSGSVEIFVESGRVRVGMENTDAFLSLEEGDFCTVNEKGIVPGMLPGHNYISWKTKEFKFVDEELGKVLRDLEESYHVVINTQDLTLDEMRITTTYREQSIDAILETIGTAFGLNVSKMEGQYYLNN
jgi:ferric-dicitrate binding protein FerR (iron transport regulator)